MRKLIYKLLTIFAKKKIMSKPIDATESENKISFYDFKLKTIDGKEIDFNIYKGKKILVVNTASACGYTPQYAALQKLHETYANKLTILGFPSDNFGGQEPGNNEEIQLFCSKNFGVTFQLFQKSDVVGTSQNPLYNWLTDKNKNGWNEEAPNWNFCKYLINEEGILVKFYSSSVDPMNEEITKQL
jgi:glutathione peroxidase